MLNPQASRFWQATILSGLMDAKGLAACWDAIPAAKREEPEHIDRRLARQAVHLRGLTLWQAQQILAGRTAGFKVDRYVLLDLIGQGGMGRVYLAQDSRLNRRVALKILSPERINNPRAIARFQREARVGAQLQHENLVRIYDFGESSGRYYLVMEYIEGKTIGTLIAEQGSVPPPTAVRLIRQVAMGLEHAHRKGLIHRDVNPYNILVTRDGTAKLADLGLAIDLAEEDRVTREGATVGTFDYVAPEQARHSHSADIRSDIYSLGCTLYHMFAGQVPFPGPSLPEKLFAHQALEPTPLREIVPGLPEGLIEVVQRMMRKSPDERYATPMQVAQALEGYQEDDSSVVAHEPAPPKLEKPPVQRQPPDPAPASPATAAAARTRKATTAPALEKTSADPGASKSPARAAADVGSYPSTVGSMTPVLSPVNDTDGSDPDFPIGLDLGPEPSLSDALSRPKPRSSSDQMPLAPRGAAGIRLPRSWLWGLSALTAIVLSTAAFLAVVNPFPHKSDAVAIQKAAADDAETRSKSTSVANTETDASNNAPDAEPAIVIRTEGDKEIAANNLTEAIQMAIGSGYVIELRNRKPLRLSSEQALDFLSSGGRVIIRAAQGIEPVIDYEMKTPKPLFATGSGVRLTLSGITIVVYYPAGTQAASQPVIKAAGLAKIDRCAFKVAAGARVKESCAIFSEGGALEIDRCWFDGFDKTIELSASNKSPAQIRQTMIVPAPGTGPAEGQSAELYGWGVQLRFLKEMGPGTKSPQRHLIMEHCTVSGAGLLDLTAISEQRPLQIEVKHCVVQADALVACKPNLDPGKQIQWDGESNQYDILGRSWIVLSARSGSPALSAAVTDLGTWKQFAAHDRDAIPSKPKFRLDPQQRSESLRPRDFALDGPGPVATMPGADPERVGPWSKD